MCEMRKKGPRDNYKGAINETFFSMRIGNNRRQDFRKESVGLEAG